MNYEKKKVLVVGMARSGVAAAQLLRAGDRHDAGDDRDVDPGFPGPVQEIVENIVAEEHLGRQEVQARVRLFLQAAQVVRLVGALDMAFRIAGAEDLQFAS